MEYNRSYTDELKGDQPGEVTMIGIYIKYVDPDNLTVPNVDDHNVVPVLDVLVVQVAAVLEIIPRLVNPSASDRPTMGDAFASRPLGRYEVSLNVAAYLHTPLDSSKLTERLQRAIVDLDLRLDLVHLPSELEPRLRLSLPAISSLPVGPMCQVDADDVDMNLGDS